MPLRDRGSGKVTPEFTVPNVGHGLAADAVSFASRSLCHLSLQETNGHNIRLLEFRHVVLGATPWMSQSCVPCMADVALGQNPFQIIKSIVSRIAVFVVHLPWREDSRAKKRLSYQPVNETATAEPVTTEVYSEIPVGIGASRSGGEDLILPPSLASLNAPDLGLMKAEALSKFPLSSCTTKAANLHDVLLAEMAGADGPNTAKTRDLISVLVSNDRSPFFCCESLGSKLETHRKLTPFGARRQAVTSGAAASL